MLLIVLGIYLLLGVATIFLMAYDPFSQTFDWGLSDGWEFFWFQRYLIWLYILVAVVVLLPLELYKRASERKYVKEWRNNGSFTRKLK
jgi:hypothetical protein